MPDRFEGVKAASDTAKQIISLSTGVVALTVTFLEKLTTKVGDSYVIPCTLRWAWVGYVCSLFFGLVTLMAITGIINRAVLDNSTPDANAVNIRIFAGLMVLSFFLAIILTIATGFSLFG